MKNLSNWRSVRVWESQVERELRQRHALWLHGLCIGSATLLLMWLAAYLQMRLGGESLALRYLVTLGVGYIGYLAIVRIWASFLLGREKAEDWANIDIPNGSSNCGGGSAEAGTAHVPSMESGGGGDFAGGGASADFSEGAGTALEAAAGAEEGAVVVVPIVAVFLIGCFVFFGAGALALLYFGWEVLLAVAVELAFSYVSARAAVRVLREGWLSAAVRLTWKPLLGALACAVALGAALDHFVPEANSLPQAVAQLKVSIKAGH